MCAMKRISTRSIKWRIRYNIHTIVKQGLRGTLCLTFMENLDYRYHQESDDYVIPDVMIICDRKYLKGSAYMGTPKFIVETLSPATALRDKTIKKISIRQPE